MRNFIGDTKAARIAFCVNMAGAITPFKEEAGLSDPDLAAFIAAVETMVAAQADADAARAAAVEATNVVDTQLGVLVSQVRLLSARMRVSTMTDAELATMAIARRSPTNTPIPAPVAVPNIVVEAFAPGEVSVRYQTPGLAGPRQLPDGSVGVEFSLRTEASVETPENGILQSVSRNPSPISTAGLPAGRVKLCARFFTRSGLNGPWSAPVAFNSQAL